MSKSAIQHDGSLNLIGPRVISIFGIAHSISSIERKSRVSGIEMF